MIANTSIASHIQRLLYLRHLALLTLLLSTSFAHNQLEIHLPWTPLSVVSAIIIGTSVWAYALLRSGRGMSEATLAGQMLADMVALTLLLYYTGGSANPFVSLYLVPVMIAATVLSGWRLGLITLAAVAAYTGLLFLPGPASDSFDFITPGSSAFVCSTSLHDHDAEPGRINWHVVGMWLNFMFSTGVIAFFIVRMARSIRQRDEALAAARENTLRNERIVALGTLAAGAAHELGTPLATMAVVVGELEETHAQDTELQQSLAIIKTQIQQCKRSISQLTANAGGERPEALGSQPLDQYIRQLMDQWQLIRPQTVPHTSLPDRQPVPGIIADPTLQQALLNLLNNAADASPEHVDLNTAWDDKHIYLDISDRGAGIPADIAEQLGKQTVSSKQGQGIGWLLSHATIERFGGTVEWRPREGGGTCIHITLPRRQA